MDTTQKLLKVYQALVHERHGLISDVFEMCGTTDVPDLFVFNALTPNLNYFRRNDVTSKRSKASGSGAAFSRAVAMWSMLGEVAERYAASIYSPESLIRATASSLGNQAFDVHRFILFSETQYQQPGFTFAPFDSHSEHNWLPVTELVSGATHLLPAPFIHLGPQIQQRAENITLPTSTGLAAGMNTEFTQLRCLCEVIERDAFASLWLLRFSAPRLVVDDETIRKLSPGVQRHLNQGPLKLHLWFVPTDSKIPVVICVAESMPDGVLTVGASANPIPAVAIDKAITEALHGFLWGRQKQQSGTLLADDADFNDPQDHLGWYLSSHRRSAFDFLFDSPLCIQACDIPVQPGDVASLVTRLDGLGYTVLAVDLTTRDLQDLGFEVWRALIVGFQPLLFGRHLVSHDRRRLDVLAEFWRLPPNRPVNTAPHPFP